MIGSLELARMGVDTAQVVTWTAFSAITLATAAGFAESLSPGLLARVDTWVTTWGPKVLSVALTAVYVLSLAWVPVLTYRLAVTYLHVPTMKRGRHAYSLIQVLRDGGTYSAGRPQVVTA